MIIHAIQSLKGQLMLLPQTHVVYLVVEQLDRDCRAGYLLCPLLNIVVLVEEDRGIDCSYAGLFSLF
jgi:hypothetical protein